MSGWRTVYPLTYWRTSWLFLSLGNDEESCRKHSHAGFCGQVFHSFGWITRSVIDELPRKSTFSFVRNCWTVFKVGCTIWHPHQQWLRVPGAPCPHRHVVVSGLWTEAVLMGGLWYLVVSFNMPFPADIRCGVSFYVLTCHLHIFFNEVSVKVFGPLLNCIVHFLVVF